MPWFLILLLLPNLLWAAAHQEAIANLNQEAMLGQRMLMDYALIGMGIKYQQPQLDLKKNIAEFEVILLKLGRNKALAAQLTDIKKSWRRIKKVLQKKPDKKRAAALRMDLEKLIRRLETLTESLVQKEDLSQMVNLAAHQKMLAQKMATLYALSAWQIEKFDFLSEFKKTVELFRQTQEKLMKYPKNSQEIKQKLAEAQKHFKWFEYAARSKSKRFIPSLILRASNRIISSMDEVTHLYNHL